MQYVTVSDVSYHFQITSFQEDHLETILETHNSAEWIQALIITLAKTRSNRPEVFSKKGVLKYIAKFTGNHLCQSLFSRVSECFPLNFAIFLRTPISIERLWWMLLTKTNWLNQISCTHKLPAISISEWNTNFLKKILN